MTQKPLLVKSFMVFTTLCASAVAQAYPLVIKVKDVPDLQYTRRNTLVAAVPSGNGLKRIAIGYDELEDDSLLVIRAPTKELPIREKLHHPRKKDPFQGSLQAVHRIVIDETEFAPCDEKCVAQARVDARRVCEYDADSKAELSLTRIDLDVRKTTGFLINCGKNVGDPFDSPVKIDVDKRKIASNQIALTYQKASPVVFEEISFPKDKVKFFNNSQLEVLVKPKLFVNIHFTEDDLKTEITSYQEQGVGTSAELAMKLKTFGFSTGFEICCDITVFNDAFYFPVVVDLPFKGTSTRKGSGIFYGFNYLGDMKSEVHTKLPNYANMEKMDPLSSAVVSFQRGEHVLSIGVRSADKDGKVRAALISPDEAKKIGFESNKSNTGVYLDITGMKNSGLHKFEIWFYAGKASDMSLLQEYAQSGIAYRISMI